MIVFYNINRFIYYTLIEDSHGSNFFNEYGLTQSYKNLTIGILIFKKYKDIL